MGDAADDAFDRAIERQAEYLMLLDGIRKTCRHKRKCVIRVTPYREDEEWIPYRCATCGDKFDL